MCKPVKTVLELIAIELLEAIASRSRSLDSSQKKKRTRDQLVSMTKQTLPPPCIWSPLALLPCVAAFTTITASNTMSPVPTSTNIKPEATPSGATQAPEDGAHSVTQLSDATLDFANRMFDLARTGNLALLDYLRAGLPPNLTNNRGDTLLMLAAYHGQTELVRQMLVESAAAMSSSEAQIPSLPGAEGRRWRGQPDPNQLNGRGQSIVAGAVFKGFDEVIRILIEHGADPTAGQPTAEDCAKMFNKWDGESGLQTLFEQAPGRGVGAREAAPPVEDREQARRVSRPQGEAQSASDVPPNANANGGGPGSEIQR